VAWGADGDSSLHISSDRWQHLGWQDVYSVRMPGTPLVQSRIRAGQQVPVYVVELKRPQVTFTFGFVDLPTGPRNPTDLQLRTLFEEGVQALQRETQGVVPVSDYPLAMKNGTCPGREYVFNVSNRTLRGKMVARLFYDQGRLYTLAVAGRNVQPQS